jgi:two-component system copper resistance phosphate regulon response regulator CusR
MNTHHILILDDDPTILSFLRESLQEEGYQVTSASNGREGLRHLRQQRYDLILLDLMMPVMDGSRFVAELRRLALVPEPPIILLSADRNVSGKVRSLGVSAGVPKPFGLDELLNLVEYHLLTAPPDPPYGAYYAPGA